MLFRGFGVANCGPYAIQQACLRLGMPIVPSLARVREVARLLIDPVINNGIKEAVLKWVPTDIIDDACYAAYPRDYANGTLLGELQRRLAEEIMHTEEAAERARAEGRPVPPLVYLSGLHLQATFIYLAVENGTALPAAVDQLHFHTKTTFQGQVINAKNKVLAPECLYVVNHRNHYVLAWYESKTAALEPGNADAGLNGTGKAGRQENDDTLKIS